MTDERMREAQLIERIAQITAHRGCGGEEHDPSKGKLHGCCVVCLTPWPCAYAGTPPALSPPARRTVYEWTDRAGFRNRVRNDRSVRGGWSHEFWDGERRLWARSAHACYEAGIMAVEIATLAGLTKPEEDEHG